MAQDYGDFARRSSAGPGFRGCLHGRSARVTNVRNPFEGYFPIGQLTPSFFCRLDDDVVYWNTSRLSG